MWSIVSGAVTEHELDPAALGLATATPESLRGGDVEFNVAVVHTLLAGEPGPVRDAVLLNAAAGIAAYDVSEAPLVDRLKAGLSRAADAVDTGAARDKLAAWLAACSRTVT